MRCGRRDEAFALREGFGRALLVGGGRGYKVCGSVLGGYKCWHAAGAVHASPPAQLRLRTRSHLRTHAHTVRAQTVACHPHSHVQTME